MLSAAGVETEVREASAPHRRPRRTRVFQWVPTDGDQLAYVERRLFASVADLVSFRTIAGLNTACVDNAAASRTLVLLHGFGSGCGNWVPNLRHLGARFRVFAVDMPGFARSKRPAVSFASAADAHRFMVDALHAWFREAALDGPAFLVGHSFGAYIAAQYAMAYPADIARLVLADPWGVPPFEEHKGRPLYVRFLRWFALEATSPLSVLRIAGPWGPNILPRLRGDFVSRWKDHVDDTMVFYDYTYHCNAGHPTGELAFQACCVGYGYAREPLSQSLEKRLDPKIHLAILYGVKTWMDRSAGHSMLQRVAAERECVASAAAEASAATRAAGGVGWVRMRTVSNAGHQVNTDNATEFSEKLSALLGEEEPPIDDDDPRSA